MTAPLDPKSLSQRELEDFLDDLSKSEKDDTAQFHKAYAEWERREEQA